LLHGLAAGGHHAGHRHRDVTTGVDLEALREIVDLVDDNADFIACIENIVMIELETVDFGWIARASRKDSHQGHQNHHLSPCHRLRPQV
jgi:hypothetical protein